MGGKRDDARGGRGKAAASSLTGGPPTGARVSRLRLGEDELAVLSFPISEPHLPESITAAEREVVAGLLAGLSNAAIAQQRGTSARTVANQIASIYRKLGISSRAELVGRLRD